MMLILAAADHLHQKVQTERGAARPVQTSQLGGGRAVLIGCRQRDCNEGETTGFGD